MTTWDWFVHSYEGRKSTLSFIISTITEEFGWRAWVVMLNALGATPETGIRITVMLANSLVFIALLETRRPLVGLILWVIAPTALATVGLFQIRQGMAFGIAMVLTLRYERPVLGWILASFVHTTFAIPALLFMAIRACGEHRWRAFVASGVSAFVLVSSAGYLFRNFGGRRIEEYANYQNDFTIKLVILLVVYSMSSVLLLYSEWKDKTTPRLKVWTELCTMHLALTLYLVLAYVLFPFGKGRVWYCVPLLLPFMVAQIRVRSAFMIWWTTGVLIVLSAEIYKSYLEEVYEYFLR
jgi:hypothetical protein